MRDDAVERLFSLLTSADRAEAMAGDLAEEREQRGWTWFWLHVVRVTFALWRSAVVGGAAASACARCWQVRAVDRASIRRSRGGLLFPHSMDSPVGWIALSFFWWGGALWTGASLVAIAPQRGMAACAMLAVVGGLLIGLWYDRASRELSRDDRFVLFSIDAGLIAAVAAADRRRTRSRAGRVVIADVPPGPSHP